MFKVEDVEDRVILGLPVLTEYGELKPLSIYEFLKRQQSIAIVAMDKKKLLSELGKSEQEETGKSDSEIFELLQEMAQLPLKELLSEYFQELYHHYMILTRYCKYFYFDRNDYETEEDFEKAALIESLTFIDELTNEQFDEFRLMLLALHATPEQTAFLNPTLQKRDERAKKIKTQNVDAPNLTTMISSCAVYMGLSYSQIAEWNALQLQHSFQRIAMFIENSATTLFATVSPDVDFINWSENINNHKEEEKDIALDTWERTMGKTLK